MKYLVSTRISELKKAVANGEQEKVTVLVEEIKRVKKDSLTNKLIQLIIDGKNKSISKITPEEINELKDSNDENKYIHFNTKGLLSEYSRCQKIKKGVSFVTVSMNREKNLLRALPTWLETDVDEIIVVDWSSKENLAEKIQAFNDSRITVIQINEEETWVLTHAFNVGLKLACREKIYKIDSDILLKKDFISKNKINENEFIRGFWKSAIDAGDEDQKYVNGTFGAFNKNLKNIGYYDERIMTYGWDDTDIYYRLVNHEGLVGKYIEYGTIFHQEQEQDDRIKHQKINIKKKFLDRFEITEVENSKNKFKSYFRDLWGINYPQQDYELQLINKNLIVGNRITGHIEALPEEVRYSELFATREFLGWTYSDFHKIRFDAVKSLHFAKLINELIRDNAENKFKVSINHCKNIKIFFCESDDLLDCAKSTIAKIVGGKDPANLPIFLISSTRNDLNSVSNENIYEVSQNLALAIHECLREEVAECNFFDCIDDLNESAEIVNLTLDSLVMSCWYYKDTVQSSLGKYSTSKNDQLFKLIISLYDERNLYRLRDYLTCLLINLSLFDFIDVYYEKSNGILVSLLSKLILGEVSKKIGFKFWNKRPTYTELFDGNVNENKTDQYVIVVANADVFFDESLFYVNFFSIQNIILAISRRDVYKSEGKYNAKLIKYPNGSPNILSADAWITPSNINLPKLDYQLGTIHCDSFFYNTILNKSKLTIINPALDFNVFHLHDERFNSSDEKQKRDAKEIESRMELEKADNNGIDPVSGVSWSSIQAYNRFKICALQKWRPNSIVIEVKKDCHIILILLVAHYLSEYLRKETDITIVLNIFEVTNKISIERFVGFLNNENLQIDIEFDKVSQINILNIQELFELIEENNSVTLINFLRHQFIGSGVGMKSLGVDLDSSEFLQINLLKSIIESNKFNSKEILDKYFESIKNNRYEYDYYLPYLSDYLHLGKIIKPLASGRPIISFVTSMFNASAYLPSFLENIHSAAVNANGEVILIDVNSHTKDEEIIKKYLEENKISKNVIRYVRLDNDPGLYKTWEYGINISRSEIISNANVDDKRSASHSRVLSEFLINNEGYAGACGSIWGTPEGPYEPYTLRVNGELWYYDNTKNDINFSDLWVSSNGIIKSRNIMHCVPVWRKKLHEKYGFFDEEAYGTSADWAFWLKCTKAGEIFKHINEVFGKYYINQKSHNRINDVAGLKELKIIENLIGVVQHQVIKQ